LYHKVTFIATNGSGICDVGGLALQMFNKDIQFHNIFKSFIRVSSSPNIANTHVVGSQVSRLHSFSYCIGPFNENVLY